MEINYLAILVSGIVAMILGALWYGPLFGKKWEKIIGVNAQSIEEKKEMQRKALPLYAIQFALVLFQFFALSYFIQTEDYFSGIGIPLLLWGAFVVPTLVGSAMWNNNSRAVVKSRFLIQSGYQLVVFVVVGFILTIWN
ncbi:MAG: DUF1761 domain-containing protein [Candidatus Paceibacterota bacterium]